LAAIPNMKSEKKKKKHKGESKREHKDSTKKTFYFDGKIELGHILTILALIIAFYTLRVSEKDLEAKVTKIEELVNRIDTEEIKRLNLQSESLNNSTANLQHTNSLWDHVFETNNHLRKISNQQFFETSMMNREIINILLSKNLVTNDQKEVIEKYYRINQLSLKMNELVELHSMEVKKFGNENAPNSDSLSVDEFNRLMPEYNANLARRIDSLNSKLGDEMNLIIEERKNIFDKLMNKK